MYMYLQLLLIVVAGLHCLFLQSQVVCLQVGSLVDQNHQTMNHTVCKQNRDQYTLYAEQLKAKCDEVTVIINTCN